MHLICKSVAKITLFVLILERLTGAALAAFMALVDIGIAVSNLLERGVYETKVQQLSGHKNVQSLNTYRTNSFNQQQIM